MSTGKEPQLVFEIGEIDEKKIIRQLGGMKDKAEAAMRKAVNRTATHLVKPIKNETLKNYAVTNIRKKDIQKTLQVYKAKKGAEISAGVMSVASQKVPLYRFETSRRMPVKKNPPEYFLLSDIMYGVYNVGAFCDYASNVCDYIFSQYKAEVSVIGTLKFVLYKKK